MSDPVLGGPAERARIPELDGLRGYAILAVFAGHVAVFGASESESAHPLVNLIAVNNGIGVSLFFVLSGFLITGILLDAKGQRSYFANFYMRRTLRIFPLYYAALAIVAVATFLLPGVSALATVPLSAHVANWTYTSNFLLAIEGLRAEPVFLRHFWSLALEEQFYLLWPAIVAAAGRKTLMRVCIAGVLLAPVIRALLISVDSYYGAYMLLPARMDALLVGAVIAIAARDPRGVPGWMHSRALGLAMAVLFAAAIAVAAVPIPLPLGIVVRVLEFSVVAIAFGVLLATLLFGGRRGAWTRAFTAAPLRFFGKYSYAIYVFHLAIIVALPKALAIVTSALGVRPNVVVFGPLALAVSTLAALASWRLIEKPVLDLRERIPVGAGRHEPRVGTAG